MPKITKTLVDATEPDPGGRRRTVWDTEIKGFGLLVLPSGVKSFVYQYRTPHGRTRRATIGQHGQWTVAEARERAEDWRTIVRAGGDPLGEKAALRQAPTMGDVLDAYLRSGRFGEKADSTRAIDRGRIERHLRPLLGREHVDTLTPEAVRRALAAIRDGKTKATVKTGKKRGKARVRGGPTTARDCIALLRAILNWALAEGIIERNPAALIKLGSHGNRDTILESPEQYRVLFETLERMEREGRIRRPVADAIRVIALTGARRGEIAGLRWQHVDLDRGLITLPPAGHKTGRRTGKPRIIGLPATAQALIARQRAGEPDDWVFPPAHGAGPVQLSKPWRTVRVEAGLPDGIGLHALRHTLGSYMAMQGAEAAEIMTALGHRQLSTAVRYIHWARDARQALAEKAGATAIAGLAAASGGPGAEVKPLDGATRSK